MRTGVGRPTTRPSDPGHANDCKAALETAFRELVAEAEEAGWDRRDADWAIMLLAGDDLRTANAEAAGRTSQARDEDGAGGDMETDFPEPDISLDESDLVEPDP